MRLYSLSIAATLCALLEGSPRALSAQTPSPAALPLTGAWTGVYQAYPHLIKMTMQMPAPGQGRMDAEMRMEPLVESRTVGRAHMGVVRVTVEYDPAARSLSITPAADATRAVGFSPPRFTGVFDDEDGLIAGVMPGARSDSSPYFVMARADDAEDAFLETLREMTEQSAPAVRRSRRRPLRLPGVGNVRIGGGGGSPGEAKIVEWAQRLATEYPDVEPYRTEVGRLFGTARHLFRDEHFVAYFGKPYDEQSRADRDAVLADIRKVPRPRANFPEERANGAVHAVESAFRASGGGTYGAPDVTLSVIALRTIQAWRTRSMAWLTSAPAELDTLKAVAAAEASEAEVLGTAWPTERRAFGEAVSASRVRVAGPVVARAVGDMLNKATSFNAVAEITAALDAVPPAPAAAAPAAPAAAAPAAAGVRARTATPRGRRTMANPSGGPPAPDSLPALLALLPADARQPHITRLESRIDELVIAEARRDADIVARFGTGLEGLRTSGQWEEQAAAKYRGLTSRPPVQALFKALADRRAPLLQAAEPTLAARIQAARSSADLAEVRSAYLSVDSDMVDPAGTRLYQLAFKQDAQLRSTEIAKAAKEAETRRREASPCASAPNSRSLGEEGDEPTARDMCLAYEQLILDTQQGVKAMQDDCRTLSGTSNPMLAINCLMGMAGGMGGGPQLSLGGFEKIACVKQGGGPTFRCNFAAQLSSANPIFGPTVNRASGEVINGYFTPRGSEWIYRRP